MSKYILPVSFFGTVFGCAVLLKNHITGGPCPSKAKIPGKTVVITGANTGIGKETAKELAKRGGRIIMGCRDIEKCEVAAKEIRGQTLNPNVYARHIDLGSIKSIRQFAERVNQEEKHVDVLINNAGVMRCPAGKTEDGFDTQFGVNHLGHFLLTNLLLEKLKDSAPSRVINLTSLAHIVGKVDFDDLNWDSRKYDTKQAYCQSKLAIVLFTRELAQRLEGTGVTVNCIHPGVVATDLGRHTGLHQSQFSTSVLSPFFTLLVKGPELGAQPSVYLAVAEELEGVTGRYYDVMTEKEPAPQALDQEASQRLWEASARLVQGTDSVIGQRGNVIGNSRANRNNYVYCHMAESKWVGGVPEDVDTDDCMTSYTHIYSPDLLKDQVAFITGGGSGIGLRVAEVLMRHGCDTVIASRNLERLTEAAKKLTAATGRHCLPLTVDVRQPQTISAALDETLRELGRIDILINNAAGNFLCPASSLSFNAFKTVLEIDTMGTFNTSKLVYDKWFKDHGGVIVNISATLGYRGQALQVHAGSAKAANDAMTKHLAVEWGPSGVRVNALAPGPISGTEGFRRLGGDRAHSAGAFSSVPLQRAGNKTEMAHSVLFLASRASSYMTGHIMVVDGGSWLTSANDVSMLMGYWSDELKRDK
ncbi:hypothetical protein DPEC_G00355510 [Dallia pectoralis]|uniref:Uncharacterized protein n=1 Tax=Dallia pectoralis TaxID=75939 RepID=A0ACC2EZH6_DALPE|nr:hypothetical protein DPEC_G00355510 [Dallia pectoralis]